MSLYIEQHGNPEGQPLVLLHGWGMSSDVWQGWLAGLVSDYRLLLVDLPGLGRSRFESDQPYSLEAVVELILPQVERLLDRPAVWLGWSLGGVVAAAIAARIADSDQQRITGLITIATNPCFVCRSDWPDAMEVATFESFQQSLQSNPLKTLNRFLMLQGQGDPQVRSLLKVLKPIIVETANHADRLPESLALLAGDYRPLFTALTMPRLLLFSDHDALVPARVMQQPLLRDNARLLHDAGHLPFITAPQPLTTIIHDWLQELTDG